MLDLADLSKSPHHGTVEVGIDFVQVGHHADLVPKAGKQRNEFSIVHAPVNGPLADLETIKM